MSREGLDDRLAALLAEGLPANVALMRLLTEAVDPGEVKAAVGRARASAGPEAAARLDALGALLDAHPDAPARVRTALNAADHAGTHANGPDHWAEVFDKLAATVPEEAVALYALGSPDLLAATAREVVERMREWGLLGTDRRLLEIGCGIGRLTLALAPDVATALGLDNSDGMIAEARRRGAGVPNVRFVRSSGRDLAAVPDASVDIVLAADVFPYLVAAGADVAAVHFREAARVLRPGGALLILNYSYTGDPARDSAEVLAGLADAGLDAEALPERPFALWDGTAFLGRRR